MSITNLPFAFGKSKRDDCLEIIFSTFFFLPVIMIRSFVEVGTREDWQLLTSRSVPTSVYWSRVNRSKGNRSKRR